MLEESEAGQDAGREHHLRAGGVRRDVGRGAPGAAAGDGRKRGAGHGRSVGRCRAGYRRRRLHQRARDVDAAERCSGNGGDQAAVRGRSLQGADQQHERDDRAHAGGVGSAGSGGVREDDPGAADTSHGEPGDARTQSATWTTCPTSRVRRSLKWSCPTPSGSAGRTRAWCSGAGESDPVAQGGVKIHRRPKRRRRFIAKSTG